MKGLEAMTAEEGREAVRGIVEGVKMVGIQTMTILGRKWRDKVNGNTYHTSQIMINGVTVGKTKYAYGYGDQYVQSAGEWLEKQGYIKLERYSNGGSQSLWQYCQDNGIHLEKSEFDCLKREL